MIASKDRSYYIGASETDKVIGNWKTKSWLDWWMQKIAISNEHFDNVYTLAGTHFEHRILESLGFPIELDKQEYSSIWLSDISSNPNNKSPSSRQLILSHTNSPMTLPLLSL